MNLEIITLWKDRMSKIGAVLCILAMLFTIDGSIAYIRVPFNSLGLFRGESVKLTGPLPPGINSVEDMTYESDSNDMGISFENVISGFWLGGRMWRGMVQLSPGIEPGHYVLSIFGKTDRKIVGSNVFKVTVYKDRASFLSDSYSLVQRYSGLSPWVLAGTFFGFVVLICGCLYLLSGRRDRLMAESGEAEIYHVVANESGSLVYFGLGERNGVEKGMRLVLMDGKRQPVEELLVKSVSETDGMAEVGPLTSVKPGYLVKKV
jgi:hypothetical protein